MKKLILLATLLSFSGMVNAFGNGGDASANANQRQGQGQGQLQGQANFNHSSTRTSTSTHQGQAQGNIGLGSGNETVVEQQYEEVKQDISAYAPDAIASPATAPCIVTWAGSAGGLGLFSAGMSGYVKDHVCALGEVARRAQAIGDMKTAQKALDMMFEMTLREAGLAEAPEQPMVSKVEQPMPSLVEIDPSNTFLSEMH